MTTTHRDPLNKVDECRPDTILLLVCVIFMLLLVRITRKLELVMRLRLWLKSLQQGRVHTFVFNSKQSEITHLEIYSQLIHCVFRTRQLWGNIFIKGDLLQNKTSPIPSLRFMKKCLFFYRCCDCTTLTFTWKLLTSSFSERETPVVWIDFSSCSPPPSPPQIMWQFHYNKYRTDEEGMFGTGCCTDTNTILHVRIKEL